MQTINDRAVAVAAAVTAADGDAGGDDDANCTDLGLHDSISLFVLSSIICVHHLHHRHENHLRETVWFNGTRSSIFRSFASDMSNQEHLDDFKDQPQ